MTGFDAWDVELHGHRMVFRTAGQGPPVVLIHGMVNSSRHWDRVARRLARHYRVVAPDLIGHGDSVAARGDYSLGAHATRIRDLLTSLGIESASIVGHSLGGGVAMQYFWQFPQRTDRLVLISSGGLGGEVSPLLRSAALPGAAALLAAVAHPGAVGGLAAAGARLRARGVGAGVYAQQISRALRPLSGPGARTAFLQTLRAVIDVRGQRVSARDRLYLLQHGPTPTLIVWGERDHTIPLRHGRDAHAAIPGSWFRTLPAAAHFPHIEDPDGLATVLEEFLAATEPAPVPDDEWGELIAARAPRQPVGSYGGGARTGG